MNKGRIIYFVLAVLFGAFMFVYGGIDDSPGGQLLGLFAGIIGIVGMMKGTKSSQS